MADQGNSTGQFIHFNHTEPAEAKKTRAKSEGKKVEEAKPVKKEVTPVPAK